MTLQDGRMAELQDVLQDFLTAFALQSCNPAILQSCNSL